MRKGLQRNAIGLVQGIVLGLSGTAPSYSLAASLGLIVVAAGIQSPAVVLLAFIPTLFVAIACQQLNRAMPDCGVSFTWCAAAFGPATGWLAGCAVIVTDVVVMANVGQVAGQYTFLLLGLEELSQSTLWTTLCGVLLIAVSTWLCYRGIRLSVRTQCVLLSFEVMALAAFAAAALVRVYRGSAPAGFMRPDWSWFDPFAIRSPAALGEGVLLAVFIYWGWDSVLAMNEESSDSDRTPGIAAVLSTVLLLATYLLVTVAAQAYAGVGAAGLGLANPRNAADVLAALSHAVLGRGIAGQLIIVSTVTSVAAS